MKNISLLIIVLCVLSILPSCNDFLNPDLEIVLDEEDIFIEFNDFRAAGLGLYAIQQKLAEQIMILGELRGDLLEITENADRDLKEIYDFNISPYNKYASPENFYKLIANCNNLMQKIVEKQPSVLDSQASINHYDQLYGEVQCMRAWAYFNAARIYKEIPYIYPFLKSFEEIEEYINTEKTIVSPEKIIFDLKGYYNDTLRNTSVTFDKIYLDMDVVIDSFTTVLEENVKAVGIDYNADNNDITWEVTTWTKDAYHALLGQMYLFRGDYSKAMEHFDFFLYNNESITSYVRYGLDRKFSFNNWRNIHTGLDNDEHIFTVWFGKNFQQRNNLQYYFSNQGINQYMLKPTALAIEFWESTFDGFKLNKNTSDPSKTYTIDKGTPGDFYRGYGVSYIYYKGLEPMPEEDVMEMLELKKEKRDREASLMMENVDTVAYKYLINKNEFDWDANIPIFRAGGIHLYAAEIYAMWEFKHDDVVYPEVQKALTILNDGKYEYDNRRMGVRGRVGFADGDEAINVGNINYLRDPVTNEVTGYIDLSSDFLAKQLYAVELILDERARELAFEGERFFDLMRVAKRTGNPAFLADKVAKKFQGQKAEEIRSKLMNEENWYLKLNH